MKQKKPNNFPYMQFMYKHRKRKTQITFEILQHHNS